MRGRWLLTAGLLAGGLLLLASFPWLRAVAHSRERAFRVGADLVTAEVVRTDEGVVTVAWHDRDWDYEADVFVESSGAYDPGEEIEVLVDHDDQTVHLPGSEEDFLEFPLGDLHAFGWLVGIGALALGAYFAWSTLRVRAILAAHPWRTLSLRWDPHRDLLVGDVGGVLVGYPADEPGHVILEVAGPVLPTGRDHSVLREVASCKLRVVDGPKQATAPRTTTTGDEMAWVMPRGPLTSGPTRRRRRTVRTEQGVEFAVLDLRGPERIFLEDTSGTVQLRLHGEGKKVALFDARGDVLGAIAYSLRSADVVLPDRSPLASVRITGLRTDRVVAPSGEEIGSSEHSGAWLGRGRTVITLRDDLDGRDRTLIALTMLTVRWRPQSPPASG